MAKTISKSKYLAGLQCAKLLWTHYNDRDAIPEPDAAKQAIFDTGHEVGDLAKQLYPGGVEVPWSRDLGETVAATRALLPRRIPIFEASFATGGGYCRADILVPVGTDQWDLYEVKSSTKVKDVNVADVAFQTDMIEKSGLKLDRLYLVHIDNTYVRNGEIDPHGLFHAEDVTDRARTLQPEVAGKLASMHAIIDDGRPDTPIGEHCFHPYACDLWPRCASFLPDHHVLELNRIRKKKAFTWIDRGLTAITDVPGGDLGAHQLIQQAAVHSGSAEVSRDEIRSWLDGLTQRRSCQHRGASRRGHL